MTMSTTPYPLPAKLSGPTPPAHARGSPGWERIPSVVLVAAVPAVVPFGEAVVVLTLTEEVVFAAAGLGKLNTSECSARLRRALAASSCARSWPGRGASRCIWGVGGGVGGGWW